MTVPELAALRDAVEAKRLEKLEEERKALLDEFREKAADLGLPFESLLPAHAPPRSRRSSGHKLTVKYRGPDGQEWAGRGKAPQWVLVLIRRAASGKSFLIQR